MQLIHVMGFKKKRDEPQEVIVVPVPSALTAHFSTSAWMVFHAEGLWAWHCLLL